jgi:hypothetical protein
MIAIENNLEKYLENPVLRGCGFGTIFAQSAADQAIELGIFSKLSRKIILIYQGGQHE